MQYIQVDDDHYIEYDDVNRTSNVFSISVLQAQIDKLTAELPAIPDDKILLDWAKKNYPGLDNIADIQKQLDELVAKQSQIISDAVVLGDIIKK